MDNGGSRTETWRNKVTGLDLLWFHSRGRWQSYIIIHMQYYSCVNGDVSFDIGIFSCIEIFWLRISNNAKLYHPTLQETAFKLRVWQMSEDIAIICTAKGYKTTLSGRTVDFKHVSMCDGLERYVLLITHLYINYY